MSTPPSPASITLHRVDPDRSMARYYALSVEITLFSDWSCTRDHGRIGSRGGRIMIGLHETRDAAEAMLRDLLASKKKRGYCEA